MIPKGQGTSLWGAENVLKVVVVAVLAQLCDYILKHSIVHFTRMTCTVYELYLNRAVTLTHTYIALMRTMTQALHKPDASSTQYEEPHDETCGLTWVVESRLAGSIWKHYLISAPVLSSPARHAGFTHLYNLCGLTCSPCSKVGNP